MISDRSSTCNINASYSKVVGSLFKPIFTLLIIVNSLLVALSHPWLQVPGYNIVINTSHHNDTHEHTLITRCSHDVNYIFQSYFHKIISLLIAYIFLSSIFL